MKITHPHGLIFFCAAALSLVSLAQAQTVTPLSFNAAGSAYSTALDRLIFISGTPDLLHVYNPASNADATVALPDAPVNLSLSPDGLHAAVQHPFSISYINLQTLAVDKIFPVTGAVTGATSNIVLGPTYVYYLNYGAGAFSINLATGASTTSSIGSLSGYGTYNLATNSIYVCYPYSLGKYDVSTGPITAQTSGPIGTTGSCSRTWYSQDFTKIYNDFGTVLNASNNPSVDMTYASSFLPGASYGIETLATSTAANTIAYVDAQPSGADEVVRLTDDNLNLVGLINIPGFINASQSYAGHAKNVFINSAGTYLYVLTQADSSSGLQYNQAIFAVPLRNPNSCAVALGAATASPSATGGIYTTTITAGPACVYSITSNVDWIKFSSPSYGSGNNTLTYQVRQNPSGSRSGVISVGSATLAVAQNASVAPLELNPLSFNVAAADYSNLLDKIVMVAGSPNELHIYDRLTQSDEIVALPANPLSVSVTPDGTHAAVGHDGSISYVNLQTAAIENSFVISAQVADVSAAGNGYIYAPGFRNSFAPPLFAVDTANGAITSLAQNALVDQFAWPQLSPSGRYLYTNTAKFDISAGTPSLVGSSSATCWEFWISQDGARLFESCGTVMQTSDTPTFNLTLLATLPLGPGSDGISQVNWAADSAIQQQTAVVTGQTFYTVTPVSNLQFYSDSGLALLKQQSFPSFLTSGTYYNGAGRYAFWSKDATHLFVILQEDTASNVLAGYAVLSVNTAPNPSSCTFQVTGPSGPISGVGGVVNFNVTASAPNCDWSTDLGASSQSLTLVSGSSGTGNGAITVNVAANYNLHPETFPLVIAGQPITLTQNPPCTYSLNPASATFFSSGGTGAFYLTTGVGCPWAATSVNGLTITSPASGTGSGAISYSVAPNITSTTAFTGINIVNPSNTSFLFTSASALVTSTPAPAALRFVPIPPCRVADTRNANGPFGGPSLGNQTTREFLILSSGCGIPNTAQAYALNVTAVPPGGIGFLTVWPAGQSQPLASTLNSDGRVKAVAAIIPAGASGGVNVYTSDTTDLVLDVSGYFVSATDTSALAFYPLTPCRIIDTRGAVGPLGGPSFATAETRTLPISSSTCNIPATAQAYSLNFTVVPVGGLGYLASWPTGQPKPVASVLNAKHLPVANAAIVPAGTNGSIQVYASDATDLVLDIDGYYAPPASGGLSLYALTPCRVLDTRINYAYPSSGISGVTSIPIASQYSCSLPSNAQAFVMNATVVPATPLGFLSIWGDGQAQPISSTLNDWDAIVMSNLAIAPTQYGSVNVYPSSPTQLIIDVSGYFAP